MAGYEYLQSWWQRECCKFWPEGMLRTAVLLVSRSDSDTVFLFKKRKWHSTHNYHQSKECNNWREWYKETHTRLSEHMDLKKVVTFHTHTQSFADPRNPKASSNKCLTNSVSWLFLPPPSTRLSTRQQSQKFLPAFAMTILSHLSLPPLAGIKQWHLPPVEKTQGGGGRKKARTEVDYGGGGR